MSELRIVNSEFLKNVRIVKCKHILLKKVRIRKKKVQIANFKQRIPKKLSELRIVNSEFFKKVRIVNC